MMNLIIRLHLVWRFIFPTCTCRLVGLMCVLTEHYSWAELPFLSHSTPDQNTTMCTVYILVLCYSWFQANWFLHYLGPMYRRLLLDFLIVVNVGNLKHVHILVLTVYLCEKDAPHQKNDSLDAWVGNKIGYPTLYTYYRSGEKIIQF